MKYYCPHCGNKSIFRRDGLQKISYLIDGDGCHIDTHLFQGQFEDEIYCNDCLHESVKLDSLYHAVSYSDNNIADTVDFLSALEAKAFIGEKEDWYFVPAVEDEMFK